MPAVTVWEFLKLNGPDTVWLVNCDPSLVLKLAAIRCLAPWIQAKLVAVDIVLRAPRGGWRDKLAILLKRFLLRGVDHFIHYFRDLSGYKRVFDIGPDRSSFIPFKSNLAEAHEVDKNSEGEYILCFGRSLRDYDTFLAAIERLPYPAAISPQDPEQLRTHASRFTRSMEDLPQNLRILNDDGSMAAQLRVLNGAKIVVLPILQTSLVASGISSCLNAMILGKCVVGTEGPGMTDIFTHGEVLVAPPEEPEQLAAVIRQAWEDHDLRIRTAEAGYRYARALGGEPELYQRIIDCINDVYGGTKCAASQE